MPIPAYLKNVEIKNLKRLDNDVIEGTITMPCAADTTDLDVRFEPITKSVFIRKLQVYIDGVLYDELDCCDKVVEMYFGMKDTIRSNESSELAARRANITKILANNANRGLI